MKLPGDHFGLLVSWDFHDCTRFGNLNWHYLFCSVHTLDPGNKVTLLEVGTDRNLDPENGLEGKHRHIYVGWRRRDGKAKEWQFPKTKWVPLR